MPSSLVGFSGGTITIGIVEHNGDVLFSGLSGTIAPAATPGPSFFSLALLALGASSLLALRRRWKAA
ncbi:MAG: hypothetical protein DMF03_04600 [Verrucomicrobia bacterium]|nr:MAG: hypothetical protein DMF03_04600 [Verrucomicrobiota bacterium]